MFNLNKNGLSLIEVILAAVVFSLSVAGFFAAIEAVRKPTQNTDSTRSAADEGKIILEQLRQEVDSNKWTTSTWQDGTTPRTFTGSNGVQYTATYVVTTDAGGAKKVNVTLDWP